MRTRGSHSPGDVPGLWPTHFFFKTKKSQEVILINSPWMHFLDSLLYFLTFTFMEVLAVMFFYIRTAY